MSSLGQNYEIIYGQLLLILIHQHAEVMIDVYDTRTQPERALVYGNKHETFLW